MQVWAIKRSTAFPDTNSTSTRPHSSLAHLLPLVELESVEQITKFRLIEDAQRCLLGKLLIRFLIATRFGIHWEQIQIGRTDTGRPFLLNEGLPFLDFNLSHDSDWVVLAWSDSSETGVKVGVDVMRIKIPWEDESIDEFIEGLRDQLAPSELTAIKSKLDPEQRLQHIFALWSLKEAYSKALGLGLGFEFNRINVELHEGLRVRCFVVDGAELQDWRFQLEMLEGYFIAIAAERSIISATVHHVTLAEILAFANMTSSCN